MKPIFLNQDENGSGFLYLQLYTAIKKEILSGEMQADEKLPSLRSLASDLGISITTIELAYNQLLVEGYIYSRPRSGYRVSKISSANITKTSSGQNPAPSESFLPKPVFHLKKPQQRLHCQKLPVREMSAPAVRIPHLLQIHRLYTI